MAAFCQKPLRRNGQRTLFLNSVWDGRLGHLAFESVHNGCHEICEDRRMNNAREIHSAHPLYRALRNGLLWHCTSPQEYLQIRTCGFIKPNPSPVGKYGRLPSACQALDGVSLFDFESQPETRVLESRDKWQQFLGCAEPLTIILGLNLDRLPGRVVRYPELRDITRPLNCTDPIPWVEVCHCGQIPIFAIARYLLVCAVDYCRFEKLENLGDTDLHQAEILYAKAAWGRNRKQLDVSKINQSAEFKAQMEQVRVKLRKLGGK